MTSKLSTQKRLLRLQLRILRSLEADSKRLLGKQTPGIRKYDRECESDFRRRPKTSSKAELIHLIRRTHVTFIADFHTFNQAQRTALRLIREAARPSALTGSDGTEWMIGLEMISSRFQPELDAFQQGRLDLESFHRATRYAEEWGFPWRNYAPIFEWARENRVRLIALNRPRELPCSEDDYEQLHERDQWAAGIITDLFAFAREEKKRIKMLVLYGELHIARMHLPAQLDLLSRKTLGKKLRWINVHQNQDPLYLRLAREGLEHETDVLRLGKRSFCVLSGTPWSKLQSLVSWAEGGDSESVEYEDSPEPAEDYLSLIRTYGTALAELLGLPQPSYEGLTAKTASEADFIDELRQRDSVSKTESTIIRYHIETNHRLYIPKAGGIAYLGTATHNGAAELAAVHLLRFHSGRSNTDHLFRPDADDFFRAVLEHAFGFFGSLILNPRRKCDLPMDHLKRVERLREGEKPTHRLELQARELTLALFEAEVEFLKNEASGTNLQKFFGNRKTHLLVRLFAARYYGQILGKRLHLSVVSDEIKLSEAYSLCFAPRIAGASTFFERYLKLAKATLPASEQVKMSKAETL